MPMTCSFCGKNFNMKKNLRAHIAAIHERKEYPCPVPVCGEIFQSTFFMKAHNNLKYSGVKFEFNFTRSKFKFNVCISEIIEGFYQESGLENLRSIRNRTRIFFPCVNGHYVGSKIFLCVEIIGTFFFSLLTFIIYLTFQGSS